VIDAGPRASHRSLLDRKRELLTIINNIRSPQRALWIVEPGRVRVHLAKDNE